MKKLTDEIKLCPYCNELIINKICDNCGYNKIDYELFEKDKKEEIKYCENCGHIIKGKNCLFCRINIKEKPISQIIHEIRLKEKRKKKKNKRKNYHERKRFEQQIIAIFMIVILGFTIYYGYDFLLLQSEDQTQPIIPDPTSFDFIVNNFVNGEEIDDIYHNIYIYKCNNIAIEEIENINYNNLICVDIVDSGDSYVPKNNIEYICKLNGTYIDDYWFIPILGINTIYAHEREMI